MVLSKRARKEFGDAISSLRTQPLMRPPEGFRKPKVDFPTSDGKGSVSWSNDKEDRRQVYSERDGMLHIENVKHQRVHVDLVDEEVSARGATTQRKHKLPCEELPDDYELPPTIRPSLRRFSRGGPASRGEQPPSKAVSSDAVSGHRDSDVREVTDPDKKKWMSRIRATSIRIGKLDCGKCDVWVDNSAFHWEMGEESFRIQANSIRKLLVDKRLGELTFFGSFRGGGFTAEWLNEMFDPDGSEEQTTVKLTYEADAYEGRWPSQTILRLPALKSKLNLRAGRENPAGKPQASSRGEQLQRRAASGSEPFMRTRNSAATSMDLPPPPMTRSQPRRASTTPRFQTSQNFQPATRRSDSDQGKKVLVYPTEDSKDAVTLRTGDVDRLQNNDFLNDSLIDFEVKYIQLASLGAQQHASRCHIFNSFFYKRLVDCMGGSRIRKGNWEEMRAGYESVKRWTRGVDLFEKDFIFVPINEALHWSLIVIYKPRLQAQREMMKRKQRWESATRTLPKPAMRAEERRATRAAAAAPSQSEEAAHLSGEGEYEDDVSDLPSDPEVGSILGFGAEAAADDARGRDESWEDLNGCETDEEQRGGKESRELELDEPMAASGEGSPRDVVVEVEIEERMDTEVVEHGEEGTEQGEVEVEHGEEVHVLEGMEQGEVEVEHGEEVHVLDAVPIQSQATSTQSEEPPHQQLLDDDEACSTIFYLDSLGKRKKLHAIRLILKYLHMEWVSRNRAEKSADCPQKPEQLPEEPAPANSAASTKESCGDSDSDCVEVIEQPTAKQSVHVPHRGSDPFDDEHLSLFDEMPQRVIPGLPEQQNFVDCGLFMLRYIERWATYMPDFASGDKCPPWGRYKELQFTHTDIERYRFEMKARIEQLSEHIQAKEAKKKSSPTNAKQGEAASNGSPPPAKPQAQLVDEVDLAVVSDQKDSIDVDDDSHAEGKESPLPEPDLQKRRLNDDEETSSPKQSVYPNGMMTGFANLNNKLSNSRW